MPLDNDNPPLEPQNEEDFMPIAIPAPVAPRPRLPVGIQYIRQPDGQWVENPAWREAQAARAFNFNAPAANPLNLPPWARFIPADQGWAAVDADPAWDARNRLMAEQLGAQAPAPAVPAPDAAAVEKMNLEDYLKKDQQLMDELMKPKKKGKKLKKEGAVEQKLSDRVSLFGKKFPDSLPGEWQEYEGAGWVHSIELARFLDSYAKCQFTAKYYPKNKISRTVDGLAICMDEIKKRGMAQCEHSEYWCKKDDLIEAYQRHKKIMICKAFLVDGTYFMCDLSKKAYHRQSRMRIAGSNRYNFIAIEELGKFKDVVCKCDVCGTVFEAAMVQERVWEGRDRRVMTCNTCWNRERARNLIRPHNYAEYPMPIYRKIENFLMVGKGRTRTFEKKEDLGIRLFGVEIETEINRASVSKKGLDRFMLASNVKQVLGNEFVIIKEDGSLSMNGHYGDGIGALYAGFEVVSAPADIEVHRAKWPLLEKMEGFSHLRAWDTETCGMHVHVSKEALTTLQIGRILMLMTHNNNKKFVAKVAGRGENKYCKAFHKERFSDGIQYGEVEVRDGVEFIQANFHLPRSDDARRQAVNITNPKTIEFRVFRGTVHPRHIIRNIEFADAVCSFCHPGSRSLKELGDWKNLVHFIAENRKKYPLLADWMESDNVGLLPKRNAYGPKDTRGKVRPEVVEDLPGKTEPPPPAEQVAPRPMRLEDVAQEVARIAVAQRRRQGVAQPVEPEEQDPDIF